ncbi:PA2169 family four-helix-bundle protein [Caenimonas soli]|uniref:PA2169 family four-helix-bundle protein n=1 Tax=Caenimonas soli TaxID=2735555 RepID=UPI001551F471|nr:PA2169 family four-helix-bundle protein [Caenimonas soli]NPC55480.1 PA2169 family four-helix-bundle protein [Caenimonas soli]
MADERPLTHAPSNRLSGMPESEIQYWREMHIREPYFEEGRHFEDYSPAYEIGWTGYHDYGGEFDTAECVMATDWTVRKGVSSLSWEQARAASRAAWQRAHNAREFTTDGSATPEDVIGALNELLENARDGELGFREAAEHTKTPALSALFGRRAQDCREAAAELQEQIERLGGQVEQGGSVGGTAHRVWIQLRGLFGGASDETMLTECERGEDAALERYRKALKQNLPPEIHAMVQRQFEDAQRNHDMIKSLRDRAPTVELESAP